MQYPDPLHSCERPAAWEKLRSWGMSAQGAGNNGFTPVFRLLLSRSVPLHSLNVFLVITNAEIKFRRYKRMGTMLQLLEDVEKLMDETIRLVIYWKPEKNAPYRNLVALSLPAMDVDVQDITDVDMGMKPMDEEDDDTLGKRMQVVRPVVENTTFEQHVESIRS